MNDADKLKEIERIATMSNQELRLHMGEMTAEEMRAVKAVFGWIQRIIENEK